MSRRAPRLRWFLSLCSWLSGVEVVARLRGAIDRGIPDSGQALTARRRCLFESEAGDMDMTVQTLPPMAAL